MSDDRMYENILEEVVEENETAGNSPIYEAPVYEESVVQQEPVKAKKGFATACLVFGIFAFFNNTVFD